MGNLQRGVFVAAIPTIVQTCYFIINFINKNFILPKALKRLFDHVINEHLKLKYNKLPRGVLNPYLPGFYGETFVGKGLRTCFKIAGPIIWISRLIICFLINLIPFLGPFLVILIRAQRSGFNKHKRYFHLKGYSNAQVFYIWINSKAIYFFFGVTTLLLESIPFVGYLFIFTNAVGAAFWAGDIEKQMHSQLTKKDFSKDEKQI
ncbi:hypothetical protein CANINC_004771 [Pichia inconspicua]|uniref:Uncharacterized protein n=1 Tax=Pichia inconspicua TaxID=52247 RepID=A0A4T0WV94_9ASCO|nr:hypothetical protein CANINC_004771 [[Candida] inconspicua]